MLIEADSGKRVLFDAGASRLVFDHNLTLFVIRPQEIDAAVIWHGHYDHVGGPPSLIEAKVPLYTHFMAFSGKRYVQTGGGQDHLISPSAEMLGLLPKVKLSLSSSPLEVVPGVRTSGRCSATPSSRTPPPF